MGQHGWFAKEEKPQIERKMAVSLPAGLEGDKLSAHLATLAEIGGKRAEPQTWEDGRMAFNYHHPGVSHHLVLTAAKDSLTIKTTDEGMRGLVHGLHRMHGYQGGPLYWLVALVMDLSSLALLIFVLTGVYLWLKLLRPRWWGVLMLTAGTAYTVWVLVTLMTAGA
jgi:hypothetical protein